MSYPSDEESQNPWEVIKGVLSEVKPQEIYLIEQILRACTTTNQSLDNPLKRDEVLSMLDKVKRLIEVTSLLYRSSSL